MRDVGEPRVTWHVFIFAYIHIFARLPFKARLSMYILALLRTRFCSVYTRSLELCWISRAFVYFATKDCHSRWKAVQAKINMRNLCLTGLTILQHTSMCEDFWAHKQAPCIFEGDILGSMKETVHSRNFMLNTCYNHSRGPPPSIKSL
jgi:hypothetical protein